MRYSLSCVLFWILLSPTMTALGGEAPLVRTVIILPHLLSHDINHEDYYFSALLRLAMDKTISTHGPWAYSEYAEWQRDKRLRQSLARGVVHVIWSQTSAAFETEMLAVKYPLLKGLSRYRLLLIHEKNQQVFSAVKSLADLKRYRGGMGAQWPDVALMEANGLPLVTASGYGKLFKMLAAGRFDYFSRGIYQIQSEVSFYPDLPLAIEKTLILESSGASYFFVAKNNKDLAERLQKGLELVEQDGSLDSLFNSVPRYRWAMETLQKGGRRVISLATE